MTGRIITARHGRPDLCRKSRISAKEYGDWWQAYDRSSLVADELPPESLVEVAQKAKTVWSSTIPRAIETAAHVTKGREVPQDAMFVEAPLPPPPVPFLKLKPGTWGVISRFFWAFGYKPAGVETNDEAWERVSRVADRLIAESSNGDVLLCAHGYLNWMLDRHLTRKRGWKRVEHVGKNHYWSWRAYEAPTPLGAPATLSTQPAE